MSADPLDDRLRAGLAELGVAADGAQRRQLLDYLDELLRWNRRINMTAIRDREEALVKHLLDAASVCARCGAGALLDVGSGGGLPGIPLAILNPALEVTTVDSRQRKIAFQAHVVRRLGLRNVTPRAARVESLAADRRWPRIISRAFASLADFAECAAPLLAPGGELLAMKGRRPDAEVAALAFRWEVVTIDRLIVPGLADERHLVVLRQRDSGPDSLPASGSKA